MQERQPEDQGREGGAGQPHERQTEPQGQGEILPPRLLVTGRQPQRRAHHCDAEGEPSQLEEVGRGGPTHGGRMYQPQHRRSDEHSDQDAEHRLGDPEAIADIAGNEPEAEDGPAGDGETGVELRHALHKASCPGRCGPAARGRPVPVGTYDPSAAGNPSPGWRAAERACGTGGGILRLDGLATTHVAARAAHAASSGGAHSDVQPGAVARGRWPRHLRGAVAGRARRLVTPFTFLSF